MAAIDLISPFSPEECVDRLRAGLRNPSLDVDGRVDDDWMRLKKRIFGNNSFQTFLLASSLPHGSGTRIRGRLGMHPLVIGVLAFWFTGVVAANTLILVLTVRDWAFPRGWFIPPLMLLGGIIMTWVGRLLTRGDDRHLMEFVTHTLDAKPATDGFGK